MAAELTDRIREIADARGVSESAVLEQAVERGLQAIWEETVLSLYVAGDLDRSEAVERVGEQAVQRPTERSRPSSRTSNGERGRNSERRRR